MKDQKKLQKELNGYCFQRRCPISFRLVSTAYLSASSARQRSQLVKSWNWHRTSNIEVLRNFRYSTRWRETIHPRYYGAFLRHLPVMFCKERSGNEPFGASGLVNWLSGVTEDGNRSLTIWWWNFCWVQQCEVAVWLYWMSSLSASVGRVVMQHKTKWRIAGGLYRDLRSRI